MKTMLAMAAVAMLGLGMSATAFGSSCCATKGATTQPTQKACKCEKSATCKGACETCKCADCAKKA